MTRKQTPPLPEGAGRSDERIQFFEGPAMRLQRYSIEWVDVAQGIPGDNNARRVADILAALAQAYGEGNSAWLKAEATNARRMMPGEHAQESFRSNDASTLHHLIEKRWLPRRVGLTPDAFYEWSAEEFVWLLASCPTIRADVQPLSDENGAPDAGAVAAVATAFRRAFEELTDPVKREPESLVKAALVALGYPSGRAATLFDYESQRAKRRG